MMFFKNKKNIKIKKVKVYNNDKPLPNIEELFAKSDEVYNMITKEGKKDELNFVEARYLVYGVDLMKCSKEKFGIEFTLKESDIDYLEQIINLFIEHNSINKIDDETKYGYISGVAGIFGIIANYYKDATWINDNRDNGYKMKINDRIYYVESKIIKLFEGVEDESLVSMYANMQ